MAVAGVLAGAVFGFVVARVAGSYFGDLKMPGALPVIVSAFLLLIAAVIASWLPAARAASVDVIQALRSEYPSWVCGSPRRADPFCLAEARPSICILAGLRKTCSAIQPC